MREIHEKEGTTGQGLEGNFQELRVVPGTQPSKVGQREGDLGPTAAGK